MSISLGDETYVVIESKIFKYHHLLHFARFVTTSDNIAVIAMMPEGCHEMNATKNVEDIMGIHENPKHMFDLVFSCPASKKTLIVIEAKCDGSGGHLFEQQTMMTVDSEFGSCEPNWQDCIRQWVKFLSSTF